MFEAIRSRLVGAWRDLHARGLPSLFLFELVVVTLGVLLAQGIADWADRRAAIERMESVRAEIREELAQNLGTATLWHAAIPCLRATLEMILDDDGVTRLSPGDTRRPGVTPVKPIEIEPEMLILLRQQHGSEEAERIEFALTATQHVRANQGNLVEQWGAVQLADPARQRVDAADVQAASENAAFLLGQLTGISNAIKTLEIYGAALGLEPKLARAVRPARTCDELREVGDIAISLEDER